jgi:hypothetical protein
MRDIAGAHFLHQRQGLQAVLRPFVPQPCALAWLPGREELLVGTREGQIHHVDPALGTRLVESGLGEIAVLSLHPDRKRYLVVNRDGEWITSLFGGTVARGRHPFAGNLDGLWVGEYAVIAGDTVEGRELIILGDGQERARIPIPSRAVPLRDGDKLSIVRSVATGLEVTRVSRNVKLDGEATAHRLRVGSGQILGITPIGVAVWDRKGGPALQSLRFPDVSAGDSAATGNIVGLGTRAGGVSVVHLDRRDPQQRPQMIKAFEGPVVALAFADRGRWLATAAESLQLWTWED